MHDILEHAHSNDQVSSLNSDFIKSLFLDIDSNLWVSTFDKGLNVDYNALNQFNFERALNLKTDDSFISCMVYNAYKNDLLFGTRMNGIISRNDENPALNDKLNSYALGAITSVFEDSESNLWIGGANGLVVYDQHKDEVRAINNSLKRVGNITQVGDTIYLASETCGLSIYTLNGQRLINRMQHISGINQMIHAPASKNYFCSIYSGLYVYNRATQDIQRLELQKDGEPFDWEGAVCLNLQNDSTLWIGSLSWGLIRVNPYTLTCKNYTRNDGLPGNDVTAIEIDAQGQLWLSTSDGLSCMYSEGKFSNFSAHEGVGNFQFHRRSSCQTADACIYFGGNNGLSYFYPSQLVFNQQLKGQVVLETISAGGVEIKCGDHTGILQRSLPYTDALVLPYNYSGFSIKYTMPQVFAHKQIKYVYKLDGWDKFWRESSDMQSMYYTNLPAGNYTFLIKATRRYSKSSQLTSLAIELETAPWFSWWAFSIYGVIIVTIVVVIIMLTVHRKIARNNLLHEQSEHKRLNEINEMKYRFFTNISHELRTPLTIIHAISNIRKKDLQSESAIHQFLRNLRLNTERLRRLVDQLLTFRNLECDTLQVEISQQRLDDVINKVVEPFQLFAQQKEIKFTTQWRMNAYHCAIDRDKLEKILNNLLDNAIKYTPSGGTVELWVKDLSLADVIAEGWHISPQPEEGEMQYLQCKVSDSGIGIEANKLPRIFDRYYKGASNADYSGTGIGLNFVKRLIDLQKGQIRAVSEQGKGTQISFILPLMKEEACVEEKASPDVIISNDENTSESGLLSVDIPVSVKGKTLLIIEDDVALNKFLYATYENIFKVYSAYNSHDGLILAKNTYPDLIISDVMMGELNEGLKFCATLKKNPHISHIPVVLLTARTEKEQILEGYGYGADAYVTKPFDLHILNSHIISLLEDRDRMQRDMISHELPPKEGKVDYRQDDVVFIKQINNIIFEQYKNPTFNITSLSRDLLISRSAFYNKFTQITKLSPNDYLRKFRINKAVELMKSGQYSVTQIVDMVGFNSRSGFYSSFKKEKEMTPSEYMKSIKEL